MSIPTFPEDSATADPQALLIQQLTERAAQDPLAALLLSQLQSGSSAEGENPLELLERRLDAALRANAQLREALVAANRTTTWVARLTGACPRCWGLVTECETCGGEGRPGFTHPEVGELLNWVGPALRRAGLTISHDRYQPQRKKEEMS